MKKRKQKKGRGLGPPVPPQEAMLRWRPIQEVPYYSYREQIRDETTDVRGIDPSSPFLLNRQGKAGREIYTVAPDKWTPYPAHLSRENWLPNPPHIAPQVLRMGGTAPGSLSTFQLQQIQTQQRAWPYLKNKMRDILFGGETG